MTTSPSGKRVIPSSGPLNAELMLVAESPASREMEQGEPLVGPSGRKLDLFLERAGLDRSKIRLVNVVPVRAPHDKFDEHLPEDLEWGKALFK